jgi:hypothetical protein
VLESNLYEDLLWDIEIYRGRVKMLKWHDQPEPYQSVMISVLLLVRIMQT